MKKIWIGLVIFAAAFALSACSVVPEKVFAGDLEVEREVPTPDVGDATPSGKVTATLNNDETSLDVDGSFEGLTGPAQAAHIHLGEEGKTGGVVCTLTIDNDTSGAISGTCSVKADEQDPVANGNINLEGLRGGDYYVNVHTAANAAGEIRAQLE